MRNAKKPNPTLGAAEFSFQCDQQFDRMQPQANGRFCGQCLTTVHDFRALSTEEVMALLKANGGQACGTVSDDQLELPVAERSRKHTRLDWVLAGITASLLSITQPVIAQQQEQVQTEQTIEYNKYGYPICPMEVEEEPVDSAEAEPVHRKKKLYRKKLYVNKRFPFIHYGSRGPRHFSGYFHLRDLEGVASRKRLPKVKG